MEGDNSYDTGNMSSHMTFEIAYSLFHWMVGDISPQVLAAKHKRTNSNASVSSTASSPTEDVEMRALAEEQIDRRIRHRRSSSETTGKSVRFG